MGDDDSGNGGVGRSGDRSAKGATTRRRVRGEEFFMNATICL